MKVGYDTYYCPWCGTTINHKKYTAGTPKGESTKGGISKGHSRVSNQLICPVCGRYVKQK